jgi:hypothetical protein
MGRDLDIRLSSVRVNLNPDFVTPTNYKPCAKMNTSEGFSHSEGGCATSLWDFPLTHHPDFPILPSPKKILNYLCFFGKIIKALILFCANFETEIKSASNRT